MLSPLYLHYVKSMHHYCSTCRKVTIPSINNNNEICSGKTLLTKDSKNISCGMSYQITQCTYCNLWCAGKTCHNPGCGKYSKEKVNPTTLNDLISKKSWNNQFICERIGFTVAHVAVIERNNEILKLVEKYNACLLDYEDYFGVTARDLKRLIK